MGSEHQTWITIAVSSGVVTYILKAALTSFNEAKKDFHKLRHVAECIKREILLNILNMEDFIETIPNMDEKIKNDSRYKPFMTSNNKSADVVTSLREIMLRLPSEVVDSVVEFYYYDHEVNIVMDKMQTQDFSDLNLQRKAEVMGNFKISLESTKASGDYALLQLDEFLNKTKNGFTRTTAKKIVESFQNHVPSSTAEL
jgi:hypothetical protein